MIMKKKRDIWKETHWDRWGFWRKVKSFTIPAFESSLFDFRVQTQRSGFTNVSSKFTNFVVNAGVIS